MNQCYTMLLAPQCSCPCIFVIFELSLNFNDQPAIGAKVWPCCAALALHLAEHPELVQKRRVFEPLGLENRESPWKGCFGDLYGVILGGCVVSKLQSCASL